MLVQNLLEAWTDKAMNIYAFAAKIGGTGFASDDFLGELREEFSSASAHARFWHNQ